MPGILSRAGVDNSFKLSTQGAGSELVPVPSVEGKNLSAFVSAEGMLLLVTQDLG